MATAARSSAETVDPIVIGDTPAPEGSPSTYDLNSLLPLFGQPTDAQKDTFWGQGPDRAGQGTSLKYYTKPLVTVLLDGTRPAERRTLAIQEHFLQKTDILHAASHFTNFAARSLQRVFFDQEYCGPDVAFSKPLAYLKEMVQWHCDEVIQLTRYNAPRRPGDDEEEAVRPFPVFATWLERRSEIVVLENDIMLLYELWTTFKVGHDEEQRVRWERMRAKETNVEREDGHADSMRITPITISDDEQPILQSIETGREVSMNEPQQPYAGQTESRRRIRNPMFFSENDSEVSEDESVTSG